MPPITEFIPRGQLAFCFFPFSRFLISYTEQGDESDDDDDVEVGGVTQDYKCPISLTPLVDPVTSCVLFFFQSSPCSHLTSPVNSADILSQKPIFGNIYGVARTSVRLQAAANKFQWPTSRRIRCLLEDRKKPLEGKK